MSRQAVNNLMKEGMCVSQGSSPLPSQNAVQSLEIGVVKNLLLLYLSRIAVVSD